MSNRTRSEEEKRQLIRDTWIKVTDRFYIQQDNYCWKMYDFGVVGVDDVNPKTGEHREIGQRHTYHANIQQVCYHILNRWGCEMDTLEDIYALYSDAERIMTEEVENYISGIETGRLLQQAEDALAQSQENGTLPEELQGLLKDLQSYKETHT
jgi:hypothetical protein